MRVSFFVGFLHSSISGNTDGRFLGCLFIVRKIKRLNNAYGMLHGTKSWDNLLICDELGSSHS